MHGFRSVRSLHRRGSLRLPSQPRTHGKSLPWSRRGGGTRTGTYEGLRLRSRHDGRSNRSRNRSSYVGLEVSFCNLTNSAYPAGFHSLYTRGLTNMNVGARSYRWTSAKASAIPSRVIAPGVGWGVGTFHKYPITPRCFSNSRSTGTGAGVGSTAATATATMVPKKFLRFNLLPP